MPKIPIPALYSRSTSEEALPQHVGARIINGYTDKVDNAPVARKFPGLQPWMSAIEAYPVDGLYWWDDLGIAVGVSNGQIHEITDAYGATRDITGDALTGNNPTSFATNGWALFMADGGQIVTYHLDNLPITAPTLAIGGTTTAVSNIAFTYKINGTTYSKAAVSAGTAPGNDVIPEDKFGAVAFDIDTAGTITAVEAPDNATGYTTAALAVAALPAVASALCRMGWVTAMKDNGAFTFGTTALNAANTTVSFTDNTLYALATTHYIADADAPTAVHSVGYIDHYILAATEDAFYWCDVNAPRAWTSTSFASAEAKPDKIKAMRIGWREITLFGAESIEFWMNDGTTPFSRIEGTYVERGTVAPYSIANCAGIWVFLDNDRRVCLLEGRNPKSISGPYDDVIRDLIQVSDAIGMYVSEGKQAFYILSFPSQLLTFCYNLTNDSWSELGDWSSATGSYGIYPGRCAAYCRTWNFTIVGDSTTGKIYKFSGNRFQYGLSAMRSLFRTGQVTHGTYAFKFPRELIVRTKRGAGGVSDNEPVFTIKWRNQDMQWRPERRVSLGKIGDYEMLKRLIMCAQYRTRQYEFIHSSDCDFQLIDLEEIMVNAT